MNDQGVVHNDNNRLIRAVCSKWDGAPLIRASVFELLHNLQIPSSASPAAKDGNGFGVGETTTTTSNGGAFCL